MDTEVTKAKHVILRKQPKEGALNPVQIVERLRDYASKNPTFNAMAHSFAMRERTRQQITVHSISASMAKEGFNFSKREFQDALAFMASLKLGHLTTDHKGRITALKGIQMTLQSIGLASVSKKDSLARNTTVIPFVKLPVPIETPKVVITDTLLKKPIKETTLSIKIGYKTFNFDLFPEGRVQDLIDTIDRIYQNKDKKGV